MKKRIAALIFVLLSISLLFADVPRTISYQGFLTDSNGNAVTDGSYKLNFILTNNPGNTTSLWEETHDSVTVTNGLFNVILGSVNPIDLPFDRKYYLEVRINDGLTLLPLTELTAVPYSLNVADEAAVKRLNGQTGNIILKAGENVSISTSEDTITISSTGGGGSLTLPFNGVVDDESFAFKVRNNGNGIGIMSEATGLNPAVYALNEGNGAAGYFANSDQESDSPILYVTSKGQGNTASFINNGTDGYAGYFSTNDTLNHTSTLFAETKAKGTAAIKATNNSGVGYAGIFSIDDPNFIGAALYAQTLSGSAIQGVSYDNSIALEIISNSSEPGISATNSSESGMVAKFDDRVTSNSEPAVYITSKTDILSTPALKVEPTGRGTGGRFEINNTDNPAPALSGLHRGNGVAIQGDNNGSGANAVGVWGLSSNGSDGLPLRATQNGAGDNIAIFQAQNVNVARIDKTGKGFFNGGTQTGGADVAESFSVEGSTFNYEPGDVLAISQNSDRTVELSSKPYSKLVAGVYATKPGVLLTESNINSGNSGHIPMGVIGVLPTKVTAENGNIKRGDLLVTSSIPGYAMKGTDHELMFGAVIGKALEDFNGMTGIIQVLVNVK